ncbi:hypothetical protein FRC11_000611, partial [Ceratobasidium sp. 423]
MLFATLATLAVSFTPALAQSNGSRFVRCASTPNEKQIKLAEASFIAKKKALKTSYPDSTVVIPVHWHTIQSALEDGHIPDSQITDSLDVLNTDYKSAGFFFKLESSAYITNATWFNWAGPEEDQPEFVYQTEMKHTLRRGDASALNLYSTGFTNITQQNLLGYATFPDDYTSNPGNDGVVFRYSTVPGGSAAPVNLGKTLTHEVGHWLGLFHPFQGGCEGVGDMVLDTPAQLNQTDGCPSIAPDTCPDQPGRDGIHNFMDYSDDACLTEYLSVNPEIQYRLHREVGSVFGLDEGSHEPLDFNLLDDPERLPLLEAVVVETLRCAGVGAQIARELIQDEHILGRPVPKGTDVVFATDLMSGDKAEWGPDADEWRPTR